MKEELIAKLKNAKTQEEAEKILLESGETLNEDALKEISGGDWFSSVWKNLKNSLPTPESFSPIIAEAPKTEIAPKLSLPTAESDGKVKL